MIVEMKMRSILIEDAMKNPDQLLDILKEFNEISINAHFKPFPEFKNTLIKSMVKRGGDRFNIMASRRENDQQLMVTTMILMNEDDDATYKQYVKFWEEQIVRLFISMRTQSLFNVCEFVESFIGVSRKEAIAYIKALKEKYFDEKPKLYQLIAEKITVTSDEKSTTTEMIKKLGEEIQKIYKENSTMIIQAPLDFNDAYWPFCIMIQPTTNHGEVTLSIGYDEFLAFSGGENLTTYPPHKFENHEFFDESELNCFIDEIGYEIYTDLLGEYEDKECDKLEAIIVWKT